MEENNMFKNHGENVITFKKVRANVFKFWWVFIIIFGISILLTAVMGIRQYNSSKGSLLDSVKESERRYLASSMIYIEQEEIDLQNFREMTQSTEDSLLLTNLYLKSLNTYVQSYIEQWNFTKNNLLLNDCVALLKSNQMSKLLNEALSAEGRSPYNPLSDDIALELIPNSRCYTLTVKGEEKERVQYIADTAAEILLNQTAALLNIKNCRVIDTAVANLFVEKNGEIKVLSDVTAARENGERPLSISDFISIKSILILFVGFVFGVGAVGIIILCDKKIRSKEEFMFHFTPVVLGEVRQDRGMGLESLAASIVSRLDKEDSGSVLVAGISAEKGVITLAEGIADFGGEGYHLRRDPSIIMNSKEGMNKKIVIAEGSNLLCTPEVVKASSLAERTVLVINLNMDTTAEVTDSLRYLHTAGACLMGCVLFDS